MSAAALRLVGGARDGELVTAGGADKLSLYVADRRTHSLAMDYRDSRCEACRIEQYQREAIQGRDHRHEFYKFVGLDIDHCVHKLVTEYHKPPTAITGDDRAEFEAMMLREDIPIARYAEPNGEPGPYKHFAADVAWKAWKAAQCRGAMKERKHR